MSQVLFEVSSLNFVGLMWSGMPMLDSSDVILPVAQLKHAMRFTTVAPSKCCPSGLEGCRQFTAESCCVKSLRYLYSCFVETYSHLLYSDKLVYQWSS